MLSPLQRLEKWLRDAPISTLQRVIPSHFENACEVAEEFSDDRVQQIAVTMFKDNLQDMTGDYRAQVLANLALRLVDLIPPAEVMPE